MNTRIFLLFFWMLTLLTPGESHAFSLKQYTINDQLISNLAYRGLCDSKGYMWFGTDKGLSRFDGTQFRNYTTADGMSDNEVFNMFEDSKGRLWLFTFNGQPCYYFKGKFYTADNDPKLRNIPVMPFITAMYEAEGNLYIGYRRGTVIKLDTHNRVSRVLGNIDGDHLWALVKKGKGLMAAFYEHEYDILGDKIIASRTGVSGNRFKQESLLLNAGPKGISISGPGQEQWLYPDTSLNAVNVQHLYADHKERIFAATLNGLVIINRRSGQKDTLLRNRCVNAVLPDKYGNYWITTTEHGIYCLNAALFRAATLFPEQSYKTSYINNTLLIQKENDLYYISREQQSLTPRHIIRFQRPDARPAYLDEELLIYSYSRQNNFSVYDRKEKTTRSLAFGVGKWRIYRLENDTFLVIDYDNIYKLYLGRHHDISIIFTAGPGQRIQKAYLTKDRQLYYTVTGHLYHYDPGNNKITLTDQYPRATGIESIYAVDSWLILCDNRKQLHLYDRRNGNKKYSIPCDYIIYRAEQAGPGEYLLETQAGYMLARIDTLPPYRLSFTNTEYPFLSLNVQDLYVQGAYLVANINGRLIYLDKSLLNKERFTPGLFVEGIEINGRKYTQTDIRLTNRTKCQLKLSLNAVSPSRDISYRYRMLEAGNPGEWYSTNSPNLDLLISKAGRYTIELRALSPNRKISAPVYIRLQLVPPFTRSLPFYILLAVLLIMTGLLMTQRYIRKKKRAFRDELEHMQLEHKAINALLNPHFLFNVVNNIQDLINTGSRESANNYLATMSKMIRQNMENLQFNLIPISNELELIRNYIRLQNLRYQDRIQLVITHDLDDPAEIVLPPLLLHTFVENAIIHGFRQDQPVFTLQISISLTINDYLSVQITDDGQGLPEEPELPRGKTSLGIDFNRKRLQRISEFYKVGFRMDLQDRTDGHKGAQVDIILYARFSRLIRETQSGSSRSLY